MVSKSIISIIQKICKVVKFFINWKFIMNKYLCPYCNPKYQFVTQTNTGKFICGLCGEEIIEKSLINFRQIISLLIVITFVFPLFYTLVIIMVNKKNSEKEIYQGYDIELNKDLKKFGKVRNFIPKKIFI